MKKNQNIRETLGNFGKNAHNSPTTIEFRFSYKTAKVMEVTDN